MPAEWEPHSATWIGWPHHAPDWPGKFEPIPWVYAEIVRALHRHERVEILCHSEEVEEETLRLLRSHAVDLSRVGLHRVATDRVWLRDSGPTAVVSPEGDVHWVQWRFNGWAKYPNHTRDQLVPACVAQISGLPLMSLAELKAEYPDLAARLGPNDLWTAAAEQALLERFWR